MGIILIGYKTAKKIIGLYSHGRKFNSELLLPSGCKLIKARGKWAISYYAYDKRDLKMLKDYVGFENVNLEV